jgi:hypothetical protein
MFGSFRAYAWVGSHCELGIEQHQELLFEPVNLTDERFEAALRRRLEGAGVVKAALGQIERSDSHMTLVGHGDRWFIP